MWQTDQGIQPSLQMFLGKTLKKKTKKKKHLVYILSYTSWKNNSPISQCSVSRVVLGFATPPKALGTGNTGSDFLFCISSLSPLGLSQCPQRQIYLLTNLGFIVENQDEGILQVTVSPPENSSHEKEKRKTPCQWQVPRWHLRDSLLWHFHMFCCHIQLLFFLCRHVFFFLLLRGQDRGYKVIKGHKRLQKEERSRAKFLPALGLMELCGRQIMGGKGDGNPLQYSCLENTCGHWSLGSQSWTQLKRLYSRSGNPAFGFSTPHLSRCFQEKILFFSFTKV